MMDILFDTLFGFPTAILTIPLGLVLAYWLMVILGAVDIDLFEFDADLPEDAQSGPGFLAAMGVPAPIAASLVVLWSWLFTALGTELVKVFIPDNLWQTLLLTLVLLVSLAAAVLLSAMVAVPMQRFFKTPEARHRDSLVGKVCTITTLTVDGDFGQADFNDSGAGLLIQVRAKPENGLTKGDAALIISYDEKKGEFWVQSYKNPAAAVV